MMSRFDQNLEAVYNEERELKQHVRDVDRHRMETAKSLKLAKATAWRLAKRVNELIVKDHNPFVNLVRAEGISIDEWNGQRFAGYTAIGGRYEELLHAVAKGMTQQVLLRDGAGKFLDQHRKAEQEKKDELAQQRAKPGSEAAKPVEQRGPDKDSVEYWRARCRTLGAELRQARRDLARLEKRLGELAEVPVGA